MLNLARLQNLKMISMDSCNYSALTDLSEIAIDTALPLESRMMCFADQIENPYLFKVGETVVKVEYGKERSFSEAIVSVLRAS